jgi:hypothetical protein
MKMKLFILLIDILVTIAVLLTTVRMYLQVNKLWKRKQEGVVAESISIAANFLGMTVHLPFMARFLLIDNNIPAAVNSLIVFTGLSTMSFIGTGYWVKSNKGVGLFTLLLKSLNLERKESTHLIKALLVPSGADKILEILKKLSAIDNKIDEKEIELIQKFSKEWRIKDLGLKAGAIETVTSLSDLRRSMKDYLEMAPPKDQVAAVGDLVKSLVEVDGNVQPEEALILGEMEGMIEQHVLGDNEEMNMYEVLIVPQSDSQFNAVKELLPNAEYDEHRGGKAIVGGKFFSKEFAEAICQKYITIGLFSTVESIGNGECLSSQSLTKTKENQVIKN